MYFTVLMFSWAGCFVHFQGRMFRGVAFTPPYPTTKWTKGSSTTLEHLQGPKSKVRRHRDNFEQKNIQNKMIFTEGSSVRTVSHFQMQF